MKRSSPPRESCIYVDSDSEPGPAAKQQRVAEPDVDEDGAKDMGMDSEFLAVEEPVDDKPYAFNDISWARYADLEHSVAWPPDLHHVRCDLGDANYDKWEESAMISTVTLMQTTTETWQREVMVDLLAAFPEYKAFGYTEIAQFMFHEAMLTQWAHWFYGYKVCDFFDGFAGAGELTKALHANYRRVIAYDRTYGASHDLSTVQGLRKWVVAMRFIQLPYGCKSGVAWFSPECTSWVWVCRSRSRRSRANTYGDLAVPMVIDGNTCAERIAVLGLLLAVWDRTFTIEQPTTSILFDHPPIAQLMLATGATVVIASKFAGSQPLKLFGSSKWTASLRRGMMAIEDSLTEHSPAITDGSTIGRVEQLSKSQHYSLEFASEIASAFVIR